jgi:DNA-binding NtrC family response regulator
MLRRWDVLVVCREMGDRNALIHILVGMSVSAFSCSTLSQAEEVLSSHKINLVFCDEHFSDGSFRDLLQTIQGCISKPQIAVILHLGDLAEYKEALQEGVFEVISSPFHPTDVELAVIRAMRHEVGESFYQVSA